MTSSRIVQQNRVAALVKDRTVPVRLAATTSDFGLPAAPKPRSGPSTAHYLLLAAIHRICQPGTKAEVPDWYRRSILHSLWGFPAGRFDSQAFWDCIRPDSDRHGGGERETMSVCVVKYSASFAGEQLHSLTTAISKALQSMRRAGALAGRGRRATGASSRLVGYASRRFGSLLALAGRLEGTVAGSRRCWRCGGLLTRRGTGPLRESTKAKSPP